MLPQCASLWPQNSLSKYGVSPGDQQGTGEAGGKKRDARPLTATEMIEQREKKEDGDDDDGRFVRVPPLYFLPSFPFEFVPSDTTMKK